jgi:hypothetical protein
MLDVMTSAEEQEEEEAGQSSAFFYLNSFTTASNVPVSTLFADPFITKCFRGLVRDLYINLDS